MKHIDLHDLERYSDVLLSRSGEVVALRFAEVADAGALQCYFRGLSPGSRYNRLMGAASELPESQLDRFTHIGEDNGFSLVATTKRNGAEVIIGEARYAIDDETNSLEIGLSVDDKMQGQGIGAALLGNLACLATALGAGRLFGDTLRSNDAMLALARKAGFALSPTPDDWKQIRFEKRVAFAPVDIPCASWRLAAIAANVHAA
ncbi:GNAT family N-acetyltransferase [Rhodopseudomonas boonkerdii]|uniref:GNAT family N-acetyltransferase n=1 Tax=Rhodopseudomonas boonkerdii TaxID=475937 RepID=UPI001E42EE78|nr:GNAT family N-acetyltransferase [Rhodopseudomonas boonkerdii]UGV27701.1 GNAT family N-acetyltransferase [Rhodopseudomonas boonkerdii]